MSTATCIERGTRGLKDRCGQKPGESRAASLACLRNKGHCRPVSHTEQHSQGWGQSFWVPHGEPMGLYSCQDQKEEYKIRIFQRFLNIGAHMTILPVPLQKIKLKTLGGLCADTMIHDAYLLVGQSSWVTGYVIDMGTLFAVAQNAFSTRVVAPSQLRIPEITEVVSTSAST